MTRHVGPLVRPAHEPAPDGAIHRIRPADAGWRFVSFDVHRLAAGERVARAGDGQEVLVLVLEGTASVSVGGVADGRGRDPRDRVRRGAGRRRPVRPGRGRRGGRRGRRPARHRGRPRRGRQPHGRHRPRDDPGRDAGRGKLRADHQEPPATLGGGGPADRRGGVHAGRQLVELPAPQARHGRSAQRVPARGAVLLPLRAADGLRHPARLHRGPVAGRDDDGGRRGRDPRPPRLPRRRRRRRLRHLVPQHHGRADARVAVHRRSRSPVADELGPGPAAASVPADPAGTR